MAKHYIAMAGLHNYLPQVCEVYPTLEQAVEYLAQIHELGQDRQRRLKCDLYLKLNFRPTNPIIKDDGNEYCKIMECDCDTPQVHSDS